MLKFSMLSIFLLFLLIRILVVLLYKTKDMNDIRLTYDEFFQYIWDDSNLSRIVSVAYQSEHEDYIRSLTFDMFRIYEKANLSERVALKIFEIQFFNLFRFSPDNQNIEEIRDSYNDY